MAGENFLFANGLHAVLANYKDKLWIHDELLDLMLAEVQVADSDWADARRLAQN